jgi:membrane fusion protein, multidrug efflux system
MSFSDPGLVLNVSKYLNNSINQKPMNTPLKTHFIKSAVHLIPFALLAAIVLSCDSKADTLKAVNKAATATAPVGTPVDVVVIQPSEVHDAIAVTGTLLANQQVGIVSELTRKVVAVHVKEGSKVRKGALLFQLDDADLQAQLNRLRQQEKLASLNEQRLRDLISHEAISQQEYDEAITNLKVLQAQVDELLVLISKTRIEAPFNGQVGMINVHPGAIVSVNTILTHIEDNSIIKVEFSIPEKYASLIKPGAEQKFTTASSGRTYTAKVTALSASLDENTRTLLIRALAQNPQGDLLPGQSARLNLSLNSNGNALLVSSNALIPSSLGYSVFVARKNQAQIIPVEIGQRNAGTVAIEKGLAKGDTLITSNLLRLGPGSPVHFATLK